MQDAVLKVQKLGVPPEGLDSVFWGKDEEEVKGSYET